MHHWWGYRGHRPFGTSIPHFLTPIPFLFIFLRTLLHFFAPSKNSTLMFSGNCALFDKKHRGGYPLRLRQYRSLHYPGPFTPLRKPPRCPTKATSATPAASIGSR